MRNFATRHTQHGSSMIEVLVTIVILAFGLLGLVGLQARLQLSEMESYQRTQGLMLLDDMANRIATNRSNAMTAVAADTYVTGTSAPLGTGMACPTTTGTTIQRDLNEWCNSLQGAGESQSSNTVRVGAFIGGRGCVQSLGSGEFLVTVAWQGLGPISAPPSSVACGQGNYNGATGSACVNDLCRRFLTTIVRFATL